MDALRRELVARRDWLLAAALLVFGAAELLLGERYQGRSAWPGPALAGACQVCVFALPLAWRRTAALASTLTVLGGAALASVLWGAAESTAAFLCLLLTVFSGVAHARRPGLVGLAAVLALTAHNLRDPSVRTAVDWFWSAGFVAVAIVLGAVVRGRQARITALQADAQALSEEYAERVAAATAAERAAIARELHDIVAHAVSVIVVQSQAGARVVDDDPATARSTFATIERTGRSALADLRRLLTVLSADGTSVDPSPGLAHLEELVAGFRAGGLEVALDLPAPLPLLSGAADLASYRLVQEALTNTLRHAPGAHATVRVSCRAGRVVVEVEDTGSVARAGEVSRAVEGMGGGVGPGMGAGRGLIGMRERVALAGGTLLCCGPTVGGFRIEAELPLEHDAVEVAG
jgi:signal transduction histidine kinase